MAAESNRTDHREEEEEELKTPEYLVKKRKKKKQITKETEKTDEEETMSFRVKQIPEKSDRIPPIVAYFSSGYDPPVKALEPNDNDGDGDSPRVRVYRNKAETKSKRLQVVVSPTGSKVDFVGSNYSGEGATGQMCVYKLGVLDKETQTLKIVPIASNKIFRLEPRVLESDDSEAPLSTVTTEITAAERAEKKTKLNNLYGTKTAINRDKKMRALNLGDDPESQKYLNEKLKEVEIKKEALESTRSLVVRNIPPYDASATSPREAYPLDKIILKGEWDYLQDVDELLQQGTAASTDGYPVFVRNRIYKLRDIKDENDKNTLSCVLSFLAHLVKFKDLNSLNGYASAKNHQLPPIIRQRFKTLFKEAGTKTIPLDKINLLISYVLVLTLYVDEFKTDPEDIAKDLRMSTIDLRKHFENLGCKFSKVNTVLHATLPVPLKFPQVTRRRRR